MSEVKFGTGGFRGIIGDNFTRDNVEKIAQAMCNIAKRNGYKKEICIGYDNRFMSESFAVWAARVFSANGFQVELMANACATPVVMYRTLVANNDYGMMITASHNPYMYNGVKVFTKNGRDAGVEETLEIEKEFNCLNKVNTSDSDDNISYVDYVDEFVNYLVDNQHIDKCPHIRVIFDTKYGSTVEEIELLCKKIGLSNYEIINRKRDAFFNFITPAPSRENTKELTDKVLANKADIGFVLDADGDRLGIVDEKGNYIDNNIILSLIYYYLVKYEKKHGDVVKNVATSSLLDSVASRLGYACHEVPVGFKYVTRGLLETSSIIGGESSGGLALRNHIYGKDSLVSIAICLNILSKLEKPFSALVEELYAFSGFEGHILDREYHYNLSEEKAIKDKLFIKKEIPDFKMKIKEVSYKDGIKVYFDNGDWSLVRFSGTEPLLRIFNEHKEVKDNDTDFKTWESFLNL